MDMLANNSSMSLQSEVSSSNGSSSTASSSSIFSNLRRPGHIRGRSEHLISSFSNTFNTHKRGRSVSPVKSFVSDQDSFTSATSSEQFSSNRRSLQEYDDDDIYFRPNNLLHRISNSPIQSSNSNNDNFVMVNGLPYPLQIIFPQKISKKNGQKQAAVSGSASPSTPAKSSSSILPLYNLDSPSNTPTRSNLTGVTSPILLSPRTENSTLSHFTHTNSPLPSSPLTSPVSHSKNNEESFLKPSRSPRSSSHKKSRSLGSISALAQLTDRSSSPSSSPSPSPSVRKGHMKQDSRMLSTVVELDPYQDEQIAKPTKFPLLEKKSRLRLVVPKQNQKDMIDSSTAKRTFSPFGLNLLMRKSESSTDLEGDIIEGYSPPLVTAIDKTTGAVKDTMDRHDDSQKNLYPPHLQGKRATDEHTTMKPEYTEKGKETDADNAVESRDTFDTTLPSLQLPKKNRSGPIGNRQTSYDYAPLSVYFSYMEEQRQISLRKQYPTMD